MEMQEEELPSCSMCLGSSDAEYMRYNMAVSGVILPIVGLIGLCGNFLVVIVYGSAEQRVNSTSIYLAALAASDFLMICTALVLYVFEAWRHQGLHLVATIYGRSAPYVFPISTVLQTTSVYFCVAAATDCFIAVVLPSRFKDSCCTPRRATMTVICITIVSVIYNVPHLFELTSIDCIDERYNYSLSVQICPTELRNNVVYYQLYYTYMYTIFMAVGPLLIIVILNICVVTAVLKKGASGKRVCFRFTLKIFKFP
ncbi:putative G-protein coupled receptor C02B8.5 [Toxocara canis]|uniref:Putative G-protein coupled receptor C02B8.5 n=1 Tax=Toxocara canis TaxID=6265 RepID=A0A0B2V304_TOXCA|nr:putative G-protein coupled receptor C02B8.5 [Toxocara canis]